MALERILAVGMLALLNNFILKPRLLKQHLLLDISTVVIIVYGVFMEFLAFGDNVIFALVMFVFWGLPFIIAFAWEALRRFRDFISAESASLDFG